MLLLLTLAAAASTQAIEPIGSLQELQVPAVPTRNAGQRLLIPIELDGEPTQLVLEPFSVRSPRFQLFTVTPQGIPLELPPPPPTTWRGFIDGRADSVVTASITLDGLTAIATDYDLDRHWQIQPAAGMTAGVYSIARADELDLPEATCGVQSPPSVSSTRNGGAPRMGSRGTGVTLCEIAIDADVEFVQQNGNDFEATVADIESVMARVSEIFLRDVSVEFHITGIIVNNNLYSSTDANDLLDEVANVWQAFFNHVKADVVHLFTGKNLNGNTIGIAFVGVVCVSNRKYGLSQSRFTSSISARTELTAHEFGHNFNALHCDSSSDCRIMCSQIGSCSGPNDSFSPQTRADIEAFILTRACLIELAPAQALPIFDDFEAGFLNRDLWISSQGVFTSTAAINEPSGIRSMAVGNFANAATLENDKVVSNRVLLGGKSMVRVRYQAQVDLNVLTAALFLEFLDPSGAWVLVGGFNSFNMPQSAFVEQTLMLPPSALHDAVQFRFRTVTALGANATWFIDDFEIVSLDCNDVQPYCVAAANSVSSSGGRLDAMGTTSIAANDLELRATNLPDDSFALWIYSDQQTQVPLVNGFLCVKGTPIFRLAVVQSDASGVNRLSVDQSALAPGSTIVPGQVVYFQAWYRDAIGAGANLTNALAVPFCL